MRLVKIIRRQIQRVRKTPHDLQAHVLALAHELQRVALKPPHRLVSRPLPLHTASKLQLQRLFLIGRAGRGPDLRLLLPADVLLADEGVEGLGGVGEREILRGKREHVGYGGGGDAVVGDEEEARALCGPDELCCYFLLSNLEISEGDAREDAGQEGAGQTK